MSQQVVLRMGAGSPVISPAMACSEVCDLLPPVSVPAREALWSEMPGVSTLAWVSPYTQGVTYKSSAEAMGDCTGPPCLCGSGMSTFREGHREGQWLFQPGRWVSAYMTGRIHLQKQFQCVLHHPSLLDLKLTGSTLTIGSTELLIPCTGHALSQSDYTGSSQGAFLCNLSL